MTHKYAIYKSQLCVLCILNVRFINKSKICNLYIANVRFKSQAEQSLLLRARTLIKFGRESHSCFQQWRKDLARSLSSAALKAISEAHNADPNQAQMVLIFSFNELVIFIALK